MFDCEYQYPLYAYTQRTERVDWNSRVCGHLWPAISCITTRVFIC